MNILQYALIPWQRDTVTGDHGFKTDPFQAKKEAMRLARASPL
jgi:hypothetical protein